MREPAARVDGAFEAAESHEVSVSNAGEDGGRRWRRERERPPKDFEQKAIANQSHFPLQAKEAS